MCGIICYTGMGNAVPVLLEGLKRLEYRGYDSAGLAVGPEEAGTIQRIRASGRVEDLERRLSKAHVKGSWGIAHTRWATHGEPTEENAHPHTDCRGEVVLVHNGIIENEQELKRDLRQEGHQFASQTDTEVIAHLVEKYYQGDLEEAVLKALDRLSGTFGLAVMHARNPGTIILARRGSPIILGVGDGEILAASDAGALSPFTNRTVFLRDEEMAVIRPDGYTVKNLRNEILDREIHILEAAADDADRRGFDHYMLKEIFEQPETVANAFRGRLMEGEGVSKLGGLEPVLDRMLRLRRLIIVSCGTSYYAGMLGRYIFESLTEWMVDVELASEFRYRHLRIGPDTAVLAISQSGETADTIAALKEAQRKGAMILGIVNVVGSSIAQMTDAGVYNFAGPEIGVASTKMYTSQLVILVLMALLVGRHQRVSYLEGRAITDALKALPDQIRTILDQAPQVEALAKKYASFRDFLYVGRLYNYPTAMEGALKLKEISYIHAEGYAAGEMKHGPISLIDPSFPTIAIAPDDVTLDKMIGNIQEIRARRGPVLAVTNPGMDRVAELADDTLLVPRTLPIIQPILTIIPLQLFAYYLAREKGCNIDKPRNLAKSVTVE